MNSSPQLVDGRVHVGGVGIGVDGLARRAVQRCFGLVQQLLQAEGDGDVMQMFEMSEDAVELAVDVIPQGCGDGDLVTADLDLHGALLE